MRKQCDCSSKACKQCGHVECPEPTLMRSDTYMVFNTVDGGTVKFAVADCGFVRASQSNLGRNLYEHATMIWTDVLWSDGRPERQFVKCRVNVEQAAAALEMETSSVFFKWSGLKNACMFDQRLSTVLRSHLATVQGKLFQCKTGSPNLDPCLRRLLDQMARQLFVAADHLKNDQGPDPLYYLPDLPDHWFAYANK